MTRLKPEGTYPNRLKDYIKDWGLTAQHVAQEVGISAVSLSHYMQGRVPVKQWLRPRLAEVLHCTVEDLFPPGASLFRHAPASKEVAPSPESASHANASPQKPQTAESAPNAAPILSENQASILPLLSQTIKEGILEAARERGARQQC